MSYLETLVREARELDAEIAELTAKKAQIVERLKSELKPGEGGVVDGVKFSVRPGNRKFSLALALGLLDDDTKLKCVRPMIDDKMVRQTVEALGLIDAAMEPADPSKTILNLTG